MRVSAPNGEMFTLHIGGLTGKGIATDNLPAGVIPTLVVTGDSVLQLGAVTADPNDAKKFIVDVLMVADSGTAVITASDAGLTGEITVDATPALAKSLDVAATGSAVTVEADQTTLTLVTDVPSAVLNSSVPVVDVATLPPADAPAPETAAPETPAPVAAAPSDAGQPESTDTAAPAPAGPTITSSDQPAPVGDSASSDAPVGIVASAAPPAADPAPADAAAGSGSTVITPPSGGVDAAST